MLVIDQIKTEFEQVDFFNCTSYDLHIKIYYS